MKISQLIACAALIMASVTIGPVKSNAAEFASEYALSIHGFRIGKSQFKTSISKNSYTISGSLRAAGIASLFSSTSGTLTAKGTIAKDKLTARSFDVKYEEGKKSKRTTMSFSSGGVEKFENQPKTRKRGAWVELKTQHLAQVLDPAAAVLIPARSFRSVCSKTLSVFDGAMRADFPMKYVRTIPFSTRGYKGDAVTCRVSFKPISGYDRNKKDVKWMRDKGTIEVSFAPIGKTGLFAPVAAKVMTRIGMATIRAKRFEALTN